MENKEYEPEKITIESIYKSLTKLKFELDYIIKLFESIILSEVIPKERIELFMEKIRKYSDEIRETSSTHLNNMDFSKYAEDIYFINYNEVNKNELEKRNEFLELNAMKLKINESIHKIYNDISDLCITNNIDKNKVIVKCNYKTGLVNFVNETNNDIIFTFKVER